MVTGTGDTLGVEAERKNLGGKTAGGKEKERRWVLRGTGVTSD